MELDLVESLEPDLAWSTFSGHLLPNIHNHAKLEIRTSKSSANVDRVSWTVQSRSAVHSGPFRYWCRFMIGVIFTAALCQMGRCQPMQTVPHDGISIGNSSDPLESLDIDHWPTRGVSEDSSEIVDQGSFGEHKLSKSAFRAFSRLAFKALISKDYQDRPFRPPELDESDLTVEGRREMRRHQRKLERQRKRQLSERGPQGEDKEDKSISPDDPVPGRRRAVSIVTKDIIRPDTCLTVPLKQRVRMVGCTTKIVINNFCHGQCNSFFIPKLSKNRLRSAFESFSVCRPKTHAPVLVTLHCPSRNPPYVKRKVMKVKECSCTPAHLEHNEISQL